MFYKTVTNNHQKMQTIKIQKSKAHKYMWQPIHTYVASKPQNIEYKAGKKPKMEQGIQ